MTQNEIKNRKVYTAADTQTGKRNRVSTNNQEDSLTSQEFKDECDVNYVLRHGVSERMAQALEKWQPKYADISSIDFIGSLNNVKEAQSAFEELPAQTRDLFDDNPQAFIDFIKDPSNIERLPALAKYGATLEDVEQIENAAVAAYDGNDADIGNDAKAPPQEA